MKTLQFVSETLLQRQDKVEEGRLAVLSEVVQSSVRAANDPKSTRSKSQWLARVRTSVEAIIAPDDLTWMDDDNSLSRNQYATRALADISRRFKR